MVLNLWLEDSRQPVASVGVIAGMTLPSRLSPRSAIYFFFGSFFVATLLSLVPLVRP
jgi:hypothetical protein